LTPRYDAKVVSRALAKPRAALAPVPIEMIAGQFGEDEIADGDEAWAR